MKRLLLLTLALAMLALGVPATTEEAASAPYEEIASGVYAVTGSGYLFVGTEKAAFIDGNPRDAAAMEIAQQLAGELEIVMASTGAGGATLELGGVTLEAVAITGSIGATAYIDAQNQLIVAGAGLGAGSVNLAKQALDNDAIWYLNAYRAYHESLLAIIDKTADMDALRVLGPGATLDKQYLLDLEALVAGFLDVDTDLVLTSYKIPGDNTGNFSVKLGGAEIIVHMPFGGLYGYELGGSTICTEDTDFKYYVCDYGKFMSLRDTDIQSVYILMNDEQALVVDVDMYNGALFTETLLKVIGDRELYIYVTHGHGDHIANLQHIDPDRITQIIWPEGEVSMNFGAEYDPQTDPALMPKFRYVKDGEQFNVAGRDFIVCEMTGHTAHGTVLVDKTDRVLFSGDALGTQTYKGGTGTGSLSAEAYLAELEKLSYNYGAFFDDVYQGHNLYSTPNVVKWLTQMCEAYIEHGDKILINGTIYMFNGNILNAEQHAAIFGNALFDSQMYYAASLGINPPAQQARAAQAYDYPKKQEWISGVGAGFFGYIKTAGNADFDPQLFLDSPLGEGMIDDLYNFFIYEDQMDPALVAYWEGLGIKKELHDGDDEKRNWASYVPIEAYEDGNETKTYPVMFVLHGNDNPIKLAEAYGFVELSATEKFITIIPWADNDDIIVEEVERIMNFLRENDYPIDESRMYVTGFSKGGGATQTVAKAYPTMFAAIAPGGSQLSAMSDEELAALSENTMPVMLFSGMQDRNEPLPVGKYVALRGTTGETKIEGFNDWLAASGAVAEPLTIQVSAMLMADEADEARANLGIHATTAEIIETDARYFVGAYQNADGVDVMRVVGIENCPHWPSGGAAAIVWDFVSQFARDVETGELLIIK